MSDPPEPPAADSGKRPEVQDASPQQAQAKGAQRGPVAELLSDAFNLDWRMPRTFWALLARPRAVAEAYRRRKEAPHDPLVSRPARRFAAPFKYVVLAAAVATFLAAFVMDMEGQMQRAAEEGAVMGSGGQMTMADLPPAVRAFFDEVSVVAAQLLTKYAALTYLFIYTPIMAVATCLFFRKRGTGFREGFRRHLGLSAYMWAEFTLLVLLLGPLALVMDSVFWHNNLEMLAMFVYIVWAQMQFFDLKGGKGVLKALGVGAGAFVAITIAVNAVIVAIVCVRLYV